MKTLHLFPIRLVASACLCLMSTQLALAQTAGDVQRSVEQNLNNLNRAAPKAPTKRPVAPATTDQGFARLKEIKVNSPLFQDELMAYWLSEINKPVPAQKLADFKAFAWELFQSKGYLAYINTSAQPTPEGSVLTVSVAFPQVGKVSVVTVDGNKGKEYADEVARRFTAIYKTGTPVDVQGFENQLNAAAYDLPVDLEVSMRQVNEKVVDVVINLRPAEHKAGSVLGGVVQANNYGLDQFGREQVLASVRLAGVTPLSELRLTTQQSKGVGYYAADYSAPIIGHSMRWNVFGSQVNSEAINAKVKGKSEELGAGLTKRLSTDRNGSWYATSEATRRQSLNSTSGLETQNRVDQQLRFKLRAESAKSWVDSFTNEFVLTTGNINLDRNADDKLADMTDGGSNVAGHYQKLEMNGGLSQALDKERIYTGSIRWRAQVASKNLDTYNRISLGGVNGIRAYSSTEGVGDQGAQMSFDIIHQVVPDVYGGLFYDIGVVKNNRNGLLGATSNPGYYTLQAVGWQIGGKIGQINWSAYVAHAIGSTPSDWLSTNTQTGDYRGNVALTYAF